MGKRLINHPATLLSLLQLHGNPNRSSAAAAPRTQLTGLISRWFIDSFMLLLSLKLPNLYSVHGQHKTQPDQPKPTQQKFPKSFVVAAICNPEVLQFSSSFWHQKRIMEIWFTSRQHRKNCIPTKPNLISIYIESSQYFGQNTAKNKLIGFCLVKKQTVGWGMFEKFSLLRKKLSTLLQLQINKKAKKT